MTGLIILLGVALALLVVLFTAMLAWEMRHPPRHTAGYAVARGLAVDPGELGLAFEEWTLERPEGVKLPVWEIVNRQSSIVNPLTAVFIHGWGHSRIDTLTRVEPFQASCDRMVFYDLRGHGEASGLSRLGDREEGDLLALLERLGKGPFVLVGHSMGAVIALNAAAQPCHNAGEKKIVGVFAYGPYVDFHRSLCGRLRVAGLPARPITDLAMLVHRVMGLRPRGVSIDAVKSLQCPLLVIHSSEDCVAPVEDARMIVDAARPTASLLEILGATHLDAHSIDEARHAQRIGGFLERVRVSRD